MPYTVQLHLCTFVCCTQCSCTLHRCKVVYINKPLSHRFTLWQGSTCQLTCSRHSYSERDTLATTSWQSSSRRQILHSPPTWSRPTSFTPSSLSNLSWTTRQPTRSTRCVWCHKCSTAVTDVTWNAVTGALYSQLNLKCCSAVLNFDQVHSPSSQGAPVYSAVWTSNWL